jgi:hypothetical protein
MQISNQQFGAIGNASGFSLEDSRIISLPGTDYPKFVLVFLSTSGQILGYYLNWAVTFFFHLLSNSS